MEKFFFFFSSSSYKAPSPFRYHDRHVYTRERSWWKREKEKERGGGTEKRARREERRDLKRYAEYRLWWMPQPVATMFSLHWSALLRNISPPFPPPLPPPPRIPLLADFPTPRQTAIEPLYTLVCASEEYILHRQAAVHEQESVISIIITALVAFAE